MSLDTVAEYITQSRTLLQDLVEPYRYSDEELLAAFNAGLQIAWRMRPDLFIKYPAQSFTAVDTTTVTVDARYRSAFVYFITGQAQLRDEEDTQDSRAAALIGMFKSALVAGS